MTSEKSTYQYALVGNLENKDSNIDEAFGIKH